jgi:NodT family efflux transporter outer membrane factor (OMF) lipoprotein
MNGSASKQKSLAGLASLLLLAGCASRVPARDPSHDVPDEWHAQLPHHGQLSDLSLWWSQFNDPLLSRLIEAGQRVSPTLAEATARVGDARANRTAQRAQLLPLLDAGSSGSRGRSDLLQPLATTSSASVNVSWEIDLFGANRAGASAAQANLESSQARWHEARILVAAEIAKTYTELRLCEVLIDQAEREVESYEQTAHVVNLLARAGFETNAAADQAGAGAAQSRSALIEQRAGCDLLVKSLVSLTSEDETLLRRDLRANEATLPVPVELTVVAVPADALAQRPDVFAAARDVEMASAEASRAEAQRWPRITLAGSIGNLRMQSGGVTTDGRVWSVGPVAVTMPLFDGGARKANASAAHTRYEASTVIYSARLREAIREVESALVLLESTANRDSNVAIAAKGFASSYAAVDERYKNGGASLFELEEARRNMIAAERAVVSLHRDRIVAWIDLYLAVGGDWSPDSMQASAKVDRP